MYFVRKKAKRAQLADKRSIVQGRSLAGPGRARGVQVPARSMAWGRRAPSDPKAVGHARPGARRPAP